MDADLYLLPLYRTRHTHAHAVALMCMPLSRFMHTLRSICERQRHGWLSSKRDARAQVSSGLVVRNLAFMTQILLRQITQLPIGTHAAP